MLLWAILDFLAADEPARSWEMAEGHFQHPNLIVLLTLAHALRLGHVNGANTLFGA